MAEDTNDINMEQVNEYIKAQMLANADEVVKVVEQRMKGNKAIEKQPDSEAQARQQIRDVIDPIYGGDINEARMNAADARDYASFYRNPGNATFEAEVEATFKMLKDAGRATSRNDVLNWVKGDLHSKDAAKFDERVKAAKQRELQYAQGAVDVGSGGVNHQRQDESFAVFSNPDTFGVHQTQDEMSAKVKEMEKALAGVVF